jgi:GNAT superfamily N-acetyltransferase
VVESSGTAVRRAYRGQHIATVLKVHCLAYAQQHGYEMAATRSANPIMVCVNEHLGFQRRPGEVRLVRSLGG